MYFKDIPGKKELISELIKSVQDGRIAHAQLLLGRPGSGQLALALAYARYVMCKNRDAEDACGECSSCRKHDGYIHPDLHFTFPVVKKDGIARKDTTSNEFMTEWRSALLENPFMDMDYWIKTLDLENQQPDINTKECSQIIHNISLKAFEAEYKVFLIWMPEFLRQEGNRLLKIIEEPTDKTIILLVAENPDQILGTILSRTQLIKVPPFSAADIKQYLTSSRGISEDNAVEMSKIASGNMSQALGTDLSEDLNFSEIMLEWMRLSYALDPEPLNRWVNNIQRQGREYQKSFLRYAIYIVGIYLYAVHKGEIETYHTEEELKLISGLKKTLKPDIAESLIALLNDNIMEISRNANGKIIFMSTSIAIGRMLRGKAPDHQLFTV